MVRHVLQTLAVAAIAVQVFASGIAGGAYVDIQGSDVVSEAWAEYSCACICGNHIQGTHDINDFAAGTIATKSVSANGSYEGMVRTGSIYNHCYQGVLDVRTVTTVCLKQSNTFRSVTKCAPPPPSGPEEPFTPINICDPATGQTQCSPIVINLAYGPHELSGTDDPVDFDIDADGTPNRITWTARNSAVAFLAMDRNDNRTIDDGSELFGTATRLRSGLRAANGFEALNELDGDDDGVVGALDAS